MTADEVLTAEAIRRIVGAAVAVRPGASGRRHVEYLVAAEQRRATRAPDTAGLSPVPAKAAGSA